MVSDDGSVMDGVAGLVGVVTGGAPIAASGCTAGWAACGTVWTCPVVFPKGSIPAASWAMWLRGWATGEGSGAVLLGEGKMPLSACLTIQVVLVLVPGI